MYTCVFGLNFQTSNFEVRERIALTPESSKYLLKKLADSGIVKESLILSTCNRTEIYAYTHDIEYVINALCTMQNICPRVVKQHSYIYQNDECVKHLFKVVSGLDSMILGETAIVAQTKEAINLAKACGSLGSQLAGVFQMALGVEKEVRNKTGINNSSISLGRATLELIQSKVANLSEEGLLFIGAGQLMKQITPYFKTLKVKRKVIANRTLENARSLAMKSEAEYIALDQLPKYINDFSVIIACCNSQEPILNKEILNSAIRNKQEQFIIDLSMPLVTCLSLTSYSNLCLYTIDDIGKVVDIGRDRRKLASNEATILIENKLEEYEAWVKKRGLSPLIQAFRNQGEDIRNQALSEAFKELKNGADPYKILEDFSAKLTNKLLHLPTINLCKSQGKKQDEIIGLVNYLYDLDVEC